MNFISVERRIGLFLLVFVFSFGLANPALAQEQRERTLDEIKTEAIKRAENGMYPLIGLDPADVREAFAAIKTTDNDEWAAAFSAVADRYRQAGYFRARGHSGTIAEVSGMATSGLLDSPAVR